MDTYTAQRKKHCDGLRISKCTRNKQHYIFTISHTKKSANANCFIFKVADRKGVFPPESWFEDEDCELMIKGLNCQRWRDNLVTDKGKRMQEQPGI